MIFGTWRSCYLALSDLVLAEIGFGSCDAAIFRRSGQGIAFLEGYLVVGIRLFYGGILFGFADFFAQFGVCQRLDLYGLGFLDTHVLGVTGLVVALFLGDSVSRFGLNFKHFGLVGGFAGVAVFQFGACH